MSARRKYRQDKRRKPDRPTARDRARHELSATMAIPASASASHTTLAPCALLPSSIPATSSVSATPALAAVSKRCGRSRYVAAAAAPRN